MKTRATKKACGSLDTVLTPDFILRAMESNPLDILNNEQLKLEHLFGAAPLPEFEIHHHTPFSFTKVETIIEEHTKSGNNDTKSEKRLALAAALRKDIPLEAVLYYAVHLDNKKYVSHVLKVHPELSEWDTIYDLYQDLPSRFSKFRRIWQPLYSNDFVALLNYYGKFKSVEEHYEVFKSLAAEAAAAAEDSNKKASAAYAVATIYSSFLRKVAPSIVKDPKASEVVWNILAATGVYRGYDRSGLSIVIAKEIAGKDFPNSVTKDQLKDFLKIYMPVMSKHYATVSSSLQKVVSPKIFQGNRTILHEIFTELLREEYRAPISKEIYQNATSVTKKWNWLEHSFFRWFAHRSLP